MINYVYQRKVKRKNLRKRTPGTPTQQDSSNQQVADGQISHHLPPYPRPGGNRIARYSVDDQTRPWKHSKQASTDSLDSTFSSASAFAALNGQKLENAHANANLNETPSGPRPGGNRLTRRSVDDQARLRSQQASTDSLDTTISSASALDEQKGSNNNNNNNNNNNTPAYPAPGGNKLTRRSADKQTRLRTHSHQASTDSLDSTISAGASASALDGQKGNSLPPIPRSTGANILSRRTSTTSPIIRPAQSVTDSPAKSNNSTIASDDRKGIGAPSYPRPGVNKLTRHKPQTSQPGQLLKPTQPAQPIQPVQSMQPTQPAQPIQPVQSMQPTQPAQASTDSSTKKNTSPIASDVKENDAPSFPRPGGNKLSRRAPPTSQSQQLSRLPLNPAQRVQPVQSLQLSQPPPDQTNLLSSTPALSIDSEDDQYAETLARKRLSDLGSHEKIYSIIYTWDNIPISSSGEIHVHEFLDAVTTLLIVVDAMGPAMAFVRNDIHGNIVKVRNAANYSKQQTLQSICIREKFRGKATESLLWLKRTLSFIEIMMTQFVLGSTLKDSVDHAYKHTLFYAHNPIVRLIASNARYTLPSDPVFLSRLHHDAPAVLDGITLFVRIFRPVLNNVVQFYNHHGAENLEPLQKVSSTILVRFSSQRQAASHSPNPHRIMDDDPGITTTPTKSVKLTQRFFFFSIIWFCFRRPIMVV